MTPEQARQVQAAALVVAAYGRGESAALDVLLFDQLAADPPAPQTDDVTRGMVFLAIAAGEMLAQARGVSFDQALAELPRRDEGLISGAPSRWDDVAGLVTAIRAGQEPPPSPELDMGVVLSTGFDIALAMVTEMSTHLGKSPEELASVMAEGAAREIPQ
jgi:hypothetical protein